VSGGWIDLIMKKTYIVDGYNVIYKYPKIFKCGSGLFRYFQDIKRCREALVEFIVKHNINRNKIILVFDGKGERINLSATTRQLRERYNIEVLFSDRSKNETADDVICKIVVSKKYRNLAIVTEDIALMRKVHILQPVAEIVSPEKFLFKSKRQPQVEVNKNKSLVDAKSEAEIIDEISKKYNIEEEIEI